MMVGNCILVSKYDVVFVDDGNLYVHVTTECHHHDLECETYFKLFAARRRQKQAHPQDQTVGSCEYGVLYVWA